MNNGTKQTPPTTHGRVSILTAEAGERRTVLLKGYGKDWVTEGRDTAFVGKHGSETKELYDAGEVKAAVLALAKEYEERYRLWRRSPSPDARPRLVGMEEACGLLQIENPAA